MHGGLLCAFCRGTLAQCQPSSGGEDCPFVCHIPFSLYSNFQNKHHSREFPEIPSLAVFLQHENKPLLDTRLHSSCYQSLCRESESLFELHCTFGFINHSPNVSPPYMSSIPVQEEYGYLPQDHGSWGFSLHTSLILQWFSVLPQMLRTAFCARITMFQDIQLQLKIRSAGYPVSNTCFAGGSEQMIRLARLWDLTQEAKSTHFSPVQDAWTVQSHPHSAAAEPGSASLETSVMPWWTLVVYYHYKAMKTSI